MTKHLSTLSILHYVYGIFICLSGIAALFIVFIGGFLNSDLLSEMSNGERMPQWLGGMMQVIGLTVLFFIEVWGVLSLLSGYWISQRKHRTATMVISGLHCLNVPFGLMLGIFTFIVLADDGVAQAYGEQMAGPISMKGV